MKIMEKLFTIDVGIFLLVFLLAVITTKLPAIFFFLQNDPNYWFVGHAEWFDQKDINTYISHIITGEKEGLLIHNRYTIDEHPGALVFVPYSVLGILNRVLHFDYVFLFHVSTIFSSFFLILSCYLISGLFFRKKIFRLASFIIIVFGGGLGWLFSSSLDVKGAGFTLLNALERTHDALSTAFFLLSIFSAIKFIRSRNKLFLICSGVFAFLQTINHPPFILLYVIVFSIIAIISFRKENRATFFLAPLFLLTLFIPYFFLFLYPFINNPGFQSVVEQNLWNVNPELFILGVGSLFPFIFLYLFKKDKSTEEIFLTIVFITQALLIFSPFGFRLYFLKGFFVWLVVISFLYISQNKYLLKNAFFIALILIVLTSLTRAYKLNQMLHINKNNPLYFLSYSDKNALRFLEKNESANVLSYYFIGNAIPAHTYNKVFYGHLLVTPKANEKKEKANEFYLSMSAYEQERFLKDNRIKYVYYGVEEAIMRRESNLKYKDPFPHLRKAFRSKKAIVYEYN